MDCVACFIGPKVSPCDNYDSIIKVVKEDNTQILGYYVSPIDLQHYGRVDTLITAGAADDFIKYVQQQDMTTAQEAFKPVKDLLSQHHSFSTIPIEVIYGDKGISKCIQTLKQQYDNVLILPKMLK